MTSTLHLCSTCQNFDVATISERLARHLPAAAITIETYPCLGGCGVRGRASIAADGKWSWLFNAISTSDALDSLIEFIVLWQESPDGLIEKSKRPRGLHRHFLSRLPPIAG